MESLKIIDVQDLYNRYPNDLKPTDVQHIQEWKTSQPHLPELTDSEVAIFLHSVYWNVEMCKKKIDHFYSFRTKMTSYFSSRDPLSEDVLSVKDIMVLIVLPRRTPKDEGVVLIKMIDPDANKFNFGNFCKRMCLGLEQDILQNGPAEGYHYLIDVNGAGLAHLSKINLSLLKQMMFYLQKAYPKRVVGVHVIRNIRYLDRLISVFRPFMEKDLYRKLHIHDDMQSLFEYIPAEIIPCEFEGGKDESMYKMQEDFIAKLLTTKAYYEEDEEKRRIKENLRPRRRSSIFSEIFGLDGNFRRLSID